MVDPVLLSLDLVIPKSIDFDSVEDHYYCVKFQVILNRFIVLTYTPTCTHTL